MFKKVLISVISLLFILMGMLPVSADFVPEDNMIGETIYIEPDENIVMDNIKNGDIVANREDVTAKELSLDEKTYKNVFFLPAVLIAAIGISVLIVTDVGYKVKKSK